MTTSLPTVADCFRADSCYWGDRRDWLVVLSVHRDSEAIDRSNFAVATTLLGGESGLVAIERANHWAVGWVDRLIIDPTDRDKIRIAEDILHKIEDYPILDEAHFSKLEWDEFRELAESELRQFDGWEDVVDSLMKDGNYCIGEDASEWELIETARKKLESQP